ncbi:MAG: histidine kinase [Roseivirga sp.]|nr:histidine kinase [Roseivirga sp.]
MAIDYFEALSLSGTTGMFQQFKIAKNNYAWVLLIVLFDFVFYLFVQLVTAPTNASGNPDIVIHREAIAFGVLTSFVSLFTIHFVKKRLSTPRSSILTKYIKILVLSLLLYAGIVAAFMLGAEYLMGQQRDIGYVIGNALILMFHHFIVGNAFIAYLYLKESNQLKEALIVSEKLKTELELKALQQQMSPHFLFNNLNTLSSLIDPAQEDATAFTKSLANIYRYFTKNASEDLVSLQDELSFIEDYFDLMTQRFGEAYQLKTNMEQTDLSTILLVPMSLQLVVENAIKHNSGDRQNPLIIHMQIKEDSLIVKNELRKKSSSSTDHESGTGLKNLNDRCKLVIGKNVEYYTDANQFVVKLPLINQISHESTDH